MKEIKSHMLFRVPAKRLQKPIVLRGKPEENAAEYVRMLKQKGVIKCKGKSYITTDFCDLMELEANNNTLRARNILQEAISTTKEGSNVMQEALIELDNRKDRILTTINDLQTRTLDNIKNRIEDKVDAMSKIAAYLKDTKRFRAEREKQDMLIRIGLIIEALFEDLGPYEELLGNLALQEKTFKCKADTLSIRKEILMERRWSMNEKLKEILIEQEEIKKSLFSRIFSLREKTHSALNMVNKLMEKEVKTMRGVLDKENRLAIIRKRARKEKTEIARFYWFLDWVLSDIIGFGPSAEITQTYTPKKKVETIIEYYKYLKTFTSHLADNRNAHLVEMII